MGGFAYGNYGTMLCCRFDHGMLYSALRYGYFGGIVAKNYGGEISDCAVEHLKIQTIDNPSIMTDTSPSVTKTGLCVGGIAGYQSGGRIVNCSSFYEASCLSPGRENIGGIVGHLEDGVDRVFFADVKYATSEISNCICAGKLYGKTVGGIVGKVTLTESASEVLLRNNLSLTRVEEGYWWRGCWAA